MTKEELIEHARKMIAAPSCCAGAREAAQAWLDALGTDREKKAAAAMVAELKEDITPIDGLIAYAEGPAKASMGEKKAAAFAAKARQAKADGAKYCFCDACANALPIIENASLIL